MVPYQIFGANTQENIALNKPTFQSHEYEHFGSPVGIFDSSNAVDGLKENLSLFGGQCVISKDGYNDSTWWVNLTSIYSIHDIRIYYRTDNAPWGATNGYTARFLGFYVYVSNTTNRLDGHVCFHDTIYSKATIPAIVNITCFVYGQYVIYYNHRPQSSIYSSQYSPHAHNELCEVEVYGCKKEGYYGSNCSIPCPRNCQNVSCNMITGYCLGCKPGYQGNQCTIQCDGSSYGQDCRQRCGACLGYKQCHYINGSCLEGCDAGYEGELCKTVCQTGFYGKNCKKECSLFCKSSRDCNHVTGHCKEGCVGGWQGALCLQVAEKTDDADCLPRFYGVLVALCVCLIIIALLIAYICIYRRKMEGKLRKLNYKEEKETTASASNIISSKIDEHDKNGYQELGELALPSDYDRL